MKTIDKTKPTIPQSEKDSLQKPSGKSTAKTSFCLLLKTFISFLFRSNYGQTPDILELSLSILPSISFGIIASLWYDTHWSIIQRIVVFWVAADLVSGIASLSSESSVKWWSSRSISQRSLYLFFHILHPFLFVFFLGMDWNVAIFLWVSSFILSSILYLLPQKYSKSLLGLSFFALLLVSIRYTNVPRGTIWFPFAYFMKLVVSFPFRHQLEKKHSSTRTKDEENIIGNIDNSQKTSKTRQRRNQR